MVKSIHSDIFLQGSSQGILAYRAGPGMPVGAAGMLEKKIKNKFFHVLCMYMHLSSRHAEMLSNTLLLPFY
jgi:hypothetical protein